jgi:hypothetical protein
VACVGLAEPQDARDLHRPARRELRGGPISAWLDRTYCRRSYLSQTTSPSIWLWTSDMRPGSMTAAMPPPTVARSDEARVDEKADLVDQSLHEQRADQRAAAVHPHDIAARSRPEQAKCAREINAPGAHDDLLDRWPVGAWCRLTAQSHHVGPVAHGA